MLKKHIIDIFDVRDAKWYEYTTEEFQECFDLQGNVNLKNISEVKVTHERGMEDATLELSYNGYTRWFTRTSPFSNVYHEVRFQ